MKFSNLKLVIILLLIGVSAVLAAPLFNSFNSGELDPLIKYRVDLEKRHMGTETMENMTVKAQGAVFRRPGTEYIGDVNDSNMPARLIPFEFATNDAYILCLNGNSLSFFRTVN